MTIKKIEIRPPEGNFEDVLYPKTSADIVEIHNGDGKIAAPTVEDALKELADRKLEANQRAAAGGVSSLDDEKKVPLEELREATLTSKGVTQLSSAVDDSSASKAATPSAVKQAYDLAASKAATTVATPSADGLMSAADKEKHDTIQTGAEVNQNAFSNVKVAGSTLAADNKTDTLEIVNGDGIALSASASLDQMTISVIFSDSHTDSSKTKAATANAVKTLKDQSVLKSGSNAVDGTLYEKGATDIPNSLRPSNDLSSIPDNSHYRGSVKGKTGYPAANGSIIGYKDSSNSFAASWQLFKGDASNSKMYFRSGGVLDTWGIWSEFETTAGSQEKANYAEQNSKAYTDQQIIAVSSDGIPRLASYQYILTAINDGQTNFTIPLDSFDPEKDTIVVSQNGVSLSPANYSILKNANVNNHYISLKQSVEANTEVFIMILKNVLIGPEGDIKGQVLRQGTVPLDRMEETVETPGGAQAKVNTHASDAVKHITAAERATWNSKAAGTHSHPVSQVTGLQAALDSKETPAGAKQKVDAHANLRDNPHGVTSQQVNSLTQYSKKVTDDPVNFPIGVSVVFVGPGTAQGSWSSYGTVTTYRSEVSSNGSTYQTYTPYNETYGNGEYLVRYWMYGSNVWSEWETFETTAGAQEKVDTHAADAVKHITALERTTWNAKETPAGAQDKVNTHAADTVKHITTAERLKWNSKAEGTHSHSVSQVTGLQDTLDSKETPAGAQDKVDVHAADSVKHITASERASWNSKAAGTHSHPISQVTNLQSELDSKETPAGAQSKVNTHAADEVKHITASERADWNSKAKGIHGHAIDEVSGLQSALDSKETPAGAQGKVNDHAADTTKHITADERTEWNSKAPGTHSHSITQVTGLQSALDSKETPDGAQDKVDNHAADEIKHITAAERTTWNSKAAGTHSHSIAQVNGLQTALDAKETPVEAQAKVDSHAADAVKHITSAERTAWNSKAAGTHSHPISQVTNLQSSLDSKETPAGAQAKVDSHAADEVKHITAAERKAWDSKAEGTHNHAIAQVTGLQSTLDGKAAKVHTHSIGEVTGLQGSLDAKETPAGAQAKVDSHSEDTVKHITAAERTAWNSKAAGTHSHSVAQVNGLQAALDAKETPAGAQAKANSALSSAKSYTDSKVADLVGSAPETLDTLSELAEELGKNANFATSIAEGLALKATKVELEDHAADAVKHITTSERTAWNAKANAVHSHGIGDVNGLQNALDGKAATSHTHAIGNITNLQTTLDAKETPAGAQTKVDNHAADAVKHITTSERTAWNAKAPATHSHTVAQVTGLQAALDAKETPSGAQAKVNAHVEDASMHVSPEDRRAWNEKAGDAHSHAVAEIIGLEDVLDGKADSTHSHSIAQVTNLQSTLNAKETPAGAQSKVDDHAGDAVKHITAAERTAWNSKAAGTHSHTIAQVTNLQNTLDAKETPAGAQSKVDDHAGDAVKHITAAERTSWNSKADGTHSHSIAQVTGLQSALDAKETPTGAQAKVNDHAGDTTKHITAAERTSWNSKAAGTHSHSIAQVTGLQSALDAKETLAGAQSKVDSHASDSVKHITAAERSAWDSKAAGTHSHPISQVTNLQSTLDAKETPAGAQTKVDSHAASNAPHQYGGKFEFVFNPAFGALELRVIS